MIESIYRQLRLIRRAEEEVARLYPSDVIKSPIHLSIGQEFVAVGVNDALNENDVVSSTYRGHAAYLAKNLSADHGHNHWIGVDLRGCGSNRDAIGAQITLTARDGTKQHASVTKAGSYLSSRDRRVFFGLGANTEVGLIEIQWPNGTRQQVEPGEVDRLVRIEEPGAAELGE